jgi:hypothetical protein
MPRPHRACHTAALSQKFGREYFEHQLYSPDLHQWLFFFFLDPFKASWWSQVPKSCGSPGSTSQWLCLQSPEFCVEGMQSVINHYEWPFRVTMWKSSYIYWEILCWLCNYSHCILTFRYTELNTYLRRLNNCNKKSKCGLFIELKCYFILTVISTDIFSILQSRNSKLFEPSGAIIELILLL